MSSVYGRLADVARLRDRPVGSVIGIAIAHEVGHLLLGEHAHSRSGIMRADLNLRELIPQEFTRGQGDAIRAKLLGADRVASDLDERNSPASTGRKSAQAARKSLSPAAGLQ